MAYLTVMKLLPVAGVCLLQGELLEVALSGGGFGDTIVSRSGKRIH